jgi:23S rRNA (adenine2503-C2)-methyltransferase
LINLKALDLPSLEAFVAELGYESYRTNQIFAWIWQKGVRDIDLMTNLAKARREELKAKACVSAVKEVKRTEAEDGTAKFLFELEDGLRIESVFIPDPPRRTVCVSTQVGCALGCDICYTGQQGFRRNLKFYEIADQVLHVGLLVGATSQSRPDVIASEARQSRGPGPQPPVITNVVMMGMGEPMLNLDEVLKAADLINSDLALKIGARHITISTAGIPGGIRRLADHPKQFKLAVSLNATDDKPRERLMPINRAYPLEQLFAAIRYYTEKTRKRVTFEYVLIKGINDTLADARRLIKLLKHVPCKINLIPFNACPNRDYRSPSRESVEAFAQILYPELPAVTTRRSKGAGIRAACGQLSGQAD